LLSQPNSLPTSVAPTSETPARRIQAFNAWRMRRRRRLARQRALRLWADVGKGKCKSDNTQDATDWLYTP
jgi:hypothetical protein